MSNLTRPVDIRVLDLNTLPTTPVFDTSLFVGYYLQFIDTDLTYDTVTKKLNLDATSLIIQAGNTKAEVLSGSLDIEIMGVDTKGELYISNWDIQDDVTPFPTNTGIGVVVYFQANLDSKSFFRLKSLNFTADKCNLIGVPRSTPTSITKIPTP